MKLKFNHGGATDAVNLYSNPPSMHRLAVRRNNQTYYAKLGEVNHPDASALHVRRNGKTFAAIKNYNPLTFDECGNTWTKIGSPTLTTDNAILGTAGYFPLDSRLQCTQPLIAGGRDFSFDIYVTGAQANNGMCPVQLIFGNAATPSPLVQLRYVATSAAMRFYGTQSAYFSRSAAYGTRHHYACSYVHNAGTTYWFMDGILTGTTQTTTDTDLVIARVGNVSSATTGSGLTVDEFRILDGIALWTENFTPPTEPYEVDEYTTALLHF